MTISVKHAKIAAGQDSGDNKVSSNAWNDAHVLTGTANMLLGLDSGGLGTEVDPATLTPTTVGDGDKGDVTIAAGVWSLDSSAPNIVNKAQHAANRTDLAALGTTNPVAYLREASREGVFVFDSADHSAHVTADTAQGIYVAPASDTTGASGAWVRKFTGSVNPAWFGLVEGDNSANGAANDSAILALFACLAARAWNTGGIDRSLDPILFPPGTYWFNSTIDLKDGTVRFEGSGASMTASSARFATVLKNPAGVTCIRVQHSNTSGSSTKDGITHTNANGSLIRGFYLIGGYTTTEGEFHGIHARTKCLIENVGIEKFEGDGIRVEADTGTTGGNATSFLIRNVAVTSCRDGIHILGNNASASMTQLAQLTSCRRWGIDDETGIANTHVAPETNGCGLTDGHSPPNLVHNGGHIYQVIYGQDAGASTNAPSGTTASNTWWSYWQEGTPTATQPDWVSGTTYRAGGSYYSGLGAHLLVTPYAEVNQPPAQFGIKTLSIGSAPGGLGNGSGFYGSNGAGTGIYSNAALFSQAYDGTSSTFWAALGELKQQTIVQWRDASGQTGRLRQNGNDLLLDFNKTGGSNTLNITGPGTALTCGTGAVVPYSVIPTNLRTGSGNGARLITTAGVVPASGVYAQGDLIRNNAYSGPTLPLGWVSNTSGGFATDIWVSGLNAYGIGYVTGAGGTVTQLTSKSTGVTLNKLCGQITMNAAALAAAAKVSFVVTNSKVAATDMPDVAVASGGTANAYRASVTAVAAGSFTITVENITAGSLSEAPVLNFVVIKAVNA